MTVPTTPAAGTRAKAKKTQRIEARVTEDDARVITRAATLVNASVSSFVIHAALEKAETVVARADHTLMPAEQFDQMITALDEPTPVPELVDLAARPRRMSHR